MTFKQLEAVFWIAQLGGFSQAALKLHTTQSAVSKRVRELEAGFGTELFDRSQRAARLTEKGEEMFALAKQLLAQRDAAIEQFSQPEVIERRIRIGVTEITAMTWLPRLIDAIQRCYPKVTIEPDVDASVTLREKVLADELDLIFVPGAFVEDRLATKVLGHLQNAWMCKPGLVESDKVFRLHELANQRLLLQGSKSGAGMVVGSWMKALGVQPTNAVVINNLIALIGLAVSGLGITLLPVDCLRPMLEDGSLMVVPCNPLPPPIAYVAMHKGEHRSTLLSSIVVLAQECCDFARMFQTVE
jgi:DNA-binding transcriptional LysR family regulator